MEATIERAMWAAWKAVAEKVTLRPMLPVLLVNLAWVVLLAAWCIAYFIQERSDRAKGGRYLANLEPEPKD
jgi:hypothetical protein